MIALLQAMNWLPGADASTAAGRRAAGLRHWVSRLGLLLAAAVFIALWAYPLLGFLLSAWVPHLLQGDLRPTLAPLRHAVQGYELHALFNSLWVAL
ncbi:MAG: hypothetical protein B7X36_07185, partial [Thiomonas sp. 14-64-326]